MPPWWIKLLRIILASCVDINVTPSKLAHSVTTVVFCFTLWVLFFVSFLPFLLSFILSVPLFLEYRAMCRQLERQCGLLSVTKERKIHWQHVIYLHCSCVLFSRWVIVLISRGSRARKVILVWKDSCSDEQYRNLARLIHQW